jgi:hypothetical protein
MTRTAKRARDLSNPAVAAVFAAYPAAVRARLATLRQIILDTAKNTDGVGPLEETLKWGQPSYLTTASGSGSTIRIDRVPSDKADDAGVAMYFHCQTDLVATFRELYPTQMQYGGNRSILFAMTAKIPEQALRHCIGLALTYHARKAGSRNRRRSGSAQKSAPRSR